MQEKLIISRYKGRKAQFLSLEKEWLRTIYTAGGTVVLQKSWYVWQLKVISQEELHLFL